MTNKKLTGILSAIMISALLIPVIHSCDHSYLDVDNYPDYEYTSEWAFPLIKSTMTINSLFIDDDDQTVIVDNDDLVWLIYDGELISISGNNAFSIPNQSMDYNIEFSGLKRSNIIIDYTINFVPQEDEELTKAILESGIMNISAQAPQLVVDGGKLMITGTILNSDNGSGIPVSFTISQSGSEQVDLEGATLNFGAGNSLDIRFDIEIIEMPSNPPYDIVFSQQFNNMDFFELQGYFKQRSFLLGSDDVSLNFFRNVIDGTIYFEEPTIDIRAKNSYGIPIDIYFDAFFSANVDDTRPITGNPIPDNPWRIDYPDMDNIGDTIQTNYQINKGNSNIRDIFDILPKRVEYEVRGETNPEGDVEINHLRKDSYFNIEIEVSLPLHGRLHLAGFVDTVDFEMPEVEMLEWVELVINMVNGMPISTYLEIDFVDGNHNVLKTVLNETDEDGNPIALVLSAEIGESGELISATTTQNIIRIDFDEIGELENTEYLLLRSKVNSFGGGNESIKMYSSNELNVYIAARAGVKQNISFQDDGNK